ncbi:MAG: FAD-dependent oxidoreductase [Candidatus Rokubacteria bacterium]|nr:FAD-dependent oxidoreductase [Candidatus Rokubacteria bacterium]
MAPAFQHLFTPVRIGSLTVRNRIVSTAHGVRLGRDNVPSERDVAYYREKAKGGIGLVVMEAIRVHPTTVPNSAAIYGADARVVPGLEAVAQAVHAHGARIFGQICHQGRQVGAAYTRLPLWAPSPLPCFVNHETPHEMEPEEIREVIAGHAATARNVVAAGLDGVEIHAAHGYLIQQFLSPFSNRRTDAYGGSLDHRLRLALEVIDAVRGAVGTGVVVGMRLSGDEFTDGGLGLEEMKVIAQRLAATGKLDYLSVSQSNYYGTSFSTMVPDMSFPLAPFAYLAAGIREVVPNLPIITVTRINDPVLAERLLAEGVGDLVGMTRANIADPELPNKAREGRLEEIRPCIACNTCWQTVISGNPITCLINPTAGREGEWGIGTLRRAEPPKRVVIVGGGPAGLEAARVLALRGHRVVLFEKEPELGGQVRIAERAPHRQEFGGIARWLSREVRRLDVDLRLGRAATPELVLAESPDAVVVATGSVPGTGEIQAVDGARLVTGWDVLLGRAALRGHVMVVDAEYQHQAPSIAEFLVDEGCEVEIVTEKLYVGLEVPAVSLPALYARLGAKGIAFTPKTGIRAIRGKTAFLYDVFTRKERERDGVDAVVVAGGHVAVPELSRALKGRVPELYPVGDCVAPRRALHAIRDGHDVGRRI